MAGAGRLCMNFPRVAPLSGSSHLALPHKSPPRRARLCIVTLQFSVMTRTLHKQCAKCLYLSPSLPFLLSAAAVSAASIVIVCFDHRISYVSRTTQKRTRNSPDCCAALRFESTWEVPCALRIFSTSYTYTRTLHSKQHRQHPVALPKSTCCSHKLLKQTNRPRLSVRLVAVEDCVLCGSALPSTAPPRSAKRCLRRWVAYLPPAARVDATWAAWWFESAAEWAVPPLPL